MLGRSPGLVRERRASLLAMVRGRVSRGRSVDARFRHGEHASKVLVVAADDVIVREPLEAARNRRPVKVSEGHRVADMSSTTTTLSQDLSGCTAAPRGHRARAHP